MTQLIEQFPDSLGVSHVQDPSQGEPATPYPAPIPKITAAVGGPTQVNKIRSETPPPDSEKLPLDPREQEMHQKTIADYQKAFGILLDHARRGDTIEGRYEPGAKQKKWRNPDFALAQMLGLSDPTYKRFRLVKQELRPFLQYEYDDTDGRMLSLGLNLFAMHEDVNWVRERPFVDSRTARYMSAVLKKMPLTERGIAPQRQMAMLQALQEKEDRAAAGQPHLQKNLGRQVVGAAAEPVAAPPQIQEKVAVSGTEILQAKCIIEVLLQQPNLTLPGAVDEVKRQGRKNWIWVSPETRLRHQLKLGSRTQSAQWEAIKVTLRELVEARVIEIEPKHIKDKTRSGALVLKPARLMEGAGLAYADTEIRTMVAELAPRSLGRGRVR